MPTRFLRPIPSLFHDMLGVALMSAAATLAVAAGVREAPYVPTPQAVVDRMLEIAKVGPGDYLIDLGSGDGRIVITAAKKFGTRGFGVDIDPERIEESNESARREGVADLVAFYQRDLFETDLSEATVVTMYLLPQVNLELREKLLGLKPGTRIVSHDFSMDTWHPDQHVALETREKFGGSGGESDIYFWIVPAQVAGRWTWTSVVAGKELDYEVFLQQRYQALAGTVRVDGRSIKLDRARVKGDELHLEFTTIVDGMRLTHVMRGKVDGSGVSGSAMLSGTHLTSKREWVARRVEQAAMKTDREGLRRLQRSRAAPY